MRLRRECLGAAAAVLLTMHAAPAVAEPDPQDLYRRGTEAYRAARYEEAIALLSEAHRLEPHAELAYDLGRAYEGAGNLRRAVESFREYLKLAPEATDRGAVETRIANIEGRIATTREHVTIASHPDGATLVVDGHVLGSTPWKGTLTPGIHQIRLGRAGYREMSRSAVVAAGQSLVLDLGLEPEPGLRAESASASATARGGVLDRIRVPTWIAFGAGAASFGVAAAFLVGQSDSEDDARNAATQLGYRAAYQSAENNRDAARVFLGIGAAAVLTGGVLLTLDLTRHLPGEQRDTVSALRLEAGPGRAAVVGVF